MFRLFVSFYLLLMGCMFVYSMAGSVALETWLADRMVIDKTNDYIGFFHILQQLHDQVDPALFDQAVTTVPATNNIPIALLTVDQLPFDPAIFAASPIYVADADNDVLYYQLANSTRFVRLGPMATDIPLASSVSLYETIYFFFIGLGVFGWVYHLQRKLNRLDKAALSLGEGDLSVRVSTNSGHKVGNLNQSFNLMAERIEQLVKGHKNLTNAVAHELRTPVARIRFQLDMMYAEQDDKQRKEYMYGISDDLNELTDLVDELLTYARFDRETPALSLQANVLEDSLQNVIRSRQINSNSNIKLIYQPSPQSQRQYPFDPKHIERAIGNLFSNAQKYAHGQIQISVLLKNDWCSIFIDDDGPGIPAQDRQQIFVPFKRLDDSRTRATGGYGLGLAIVKQIAHWHGGHVAVTSAPIGGARFTFSWPIKPSR